MTTAIASADPTPAAPSRPSTSGRDLAARALLAGAGCAPQRVSELLGVSRRTLGRMADADRTAALHEAPLVDQARTWLVDSARRGSSTAAERDAAIAWLRDAPPDAPPVERVRPRRRLRRPGRATALHDAVARTRPRPAVQSIEWRSAPVDLGARTGRRPDAPATAHSPSQRAPHLRARGRAPERPAPDVGRRPRRALGGYHRGGPHDCELLQPARDGRTQAAAMTPTQQVDLILHGDVDLVERLRARRARGQRGGLRTRAAPSPASGSGKPAR